MNAARARRRDMPTCEEGAAFVEEIKRDLYVKKGRLYWRKRGVDRFEGARFPQRACAIFNGTNADKLAGKRDKRLGKSAPLYVRLGKRLWPVDALIRAIETGAAPSSRPRGPRPGSASTTSPCSRTNTIRSGSTRRGGIATRHGSPSFSTAW